MATATSHNKKSSAVKRILSEARELALDQSDLYTASPLEDNIFEWHFTLRGPANTEFASGLYHGRILLPAEYPMRPPNLMLLTPNGRWELNKKICLTFTGFHEEMWQPAWGIRTALLGLQTFMTAKAEAAVGIGSLDYPVQARERLAKESRNWKCDICAKTTLDMLPDPDPEQDKSEQESLPHGLTVDLDAESRKQAHKDASSFSSNAEVTSSASIQESVVPPPQQISTLAITNPSYAVAAPAVTAPNSQSQPQLQPRRTAPMNTPALPQRTSSSTSSLPGPATTSRRSPERDRIWATAQKLALIDNCIKALGILVALLILRRLI